MPTYRAPTRDTRFVVNELLKLDSYGNLPGFESADREMTDTVIDEAGRFISEVVAPLNHSGDQEGCTRHPDGSVTTPAGGSRRPTTSFANRAGAPCPRRRNSAGRACRISWGCWSRNFWRPPTRLSRCIRG